MSYSFLPKSRNLSVFTGYSYYNDSQEEKSKQATVHYMLRFCPNHVCKGALIVVKHQTKTPKPSKALTYILSLTCCFLFSLGALAGCSTPAPSAPESGQATPGAESATQGQMEEGTIIGTITTIGDTELLIEATENTQEYPIGSIRVNVEGIDSSILESLQEGDTIEITYSGQVGMSEPPYIAALTLMAVHY